jgi:peroxiredoxin
VLVFYSTECPISNYYSAALNALHSEYPISKLRIVGLCVDPDKSTQELIEHAREYRLGFPLVHDSSGCVARRFDVKVTPEVVVLDERSATRYQGRIDDQYQARQKKTAAPTKRDLSDAVARILAGEPVAVGCTEAVGCPLPAIRPARATTYTYARDVAPLLHRHCVECHREGSLAPFALETYEQARKRSGDIASVAADRLMPPWRARPGFGAAFQHDRSLTSAEITMLGTWADAGAPEGDPSELPQLPTFSEGWRLGQPDLVIEMPEEFPVPASGEDIYRCFVVKTDLPNDMYISGIEYRPGNPRVVHHILGYADVTGKAREKDEADSAPGYVCFGGPGVAINNDLGGWAPGAEASVLPEGVGRALPKGSDVIMQVHYHPSGKPERDRSRLGLTFARKPVKQTFHWSFALNDEFEIKPGDADFEVKAERVLPIDVDVHAVAPHMHMLGKDMTMWAELPGGKGRVDLIKIDRWDFKWQRQYMLQQPIRLPRGTTLKVTAHFDNSSDNPSNPSREQPIAVRWGEGTHDEMCIGFIGLVKAGQDLTQAGERDDLRQILDEGEGGSSGRDGRLSR